MGEKICTDRVDKRTNKEYNESMNMKCHMENCKSKVEHPEREDWYGLCDKHAKEEADAKISAHFSKLGKKSWEKRKNDLLNK